MRTVYIILYIINYYITEDFIILSFIIKYSQTGKLKIGKEE